MAGIDWELLEEEYDDLDSARHRRRRGRDLSTKAQERIDDADDARVVAVARGVLEIYHDDRRQPARFGGAMRGTKVAVGDRVGIRPARRASDVARVLALRERTSVLTRTPDDDSDAERVVVANADRVAVVVPATLLDQALGLIDRVLVAASVGGLDAMVVVNKVDLLDGAGDHGVGGDRARLADVVALYEALDVSVHLTSAVTKQGLDGLRADLAGDWTAFTGHSGVGKSSLFNLLVPAAEQAVADVGRHGGRHTTVAALASHVPELDAWLVDTPGLRSFGLGTLTRQQLPAHFPELAGLACALDDCMHVGEPGCARGAATLAPSRAASYERIRAALPSDFDRTGPT